MSIRGLVVDPVPNSLNLCDKNCMANSKENYQWDLSSKRVEKRGENGCIISEQQHEKVV